MYDIFLLLVLLCCFINVKSWNQEAFDELVEAAKTGDRRRMIDRGNILNDTDNAIILDAFNHWRSVTALGQLDGPSYANGGKQPIATNMNYLFWDECMSTIARNYTQQCNSGHNLNRGQEITDLINNGQCKPKFAHPDPVPYFATAEIMWPTNSIGNGQYPPDRLAELVQGWVSESVSYVYDTSTPDNENAQCDPNIHWGICGHYTATVAALDVVLHIVLLVKIRVFNLFVHFGLKNGVLVHMKQILMIHLMNIEHVLIVMVIEKKDV